MRTQSISYGLLVCCLPLAISSAYGASCFVPKAAGEGLSRGGKLTAVNSRTSVLRPCEGRFERREGGVIEVSFISKAGVGDRVQVRSGEAIQDVVAAKLGRDGKIGDVWPNGSALEVLAGWLSGKPPSLSGISGFETPPGGIRLSGDLLPLEGLALPLVMFGWAPDVPVTVKQGTFAATLQAREGWLALPVAQLREGEVLLEQSGRAAARLTIVSAQDQRDAAVRLAAIEALALDGSQKRLLRASYLQGQRYSVNAVVEFARGR